MEVHHKISTNVTWSSALARGYWNQMSRDDCSQLIIVTYPLGKWSKMHFFFFSCSNLTVGSSCAFLFQAVLSPLRFFTFCWNGMTCFMALCATHCHLTQMTCLSQLNTVIRKLLVPLTKPSTWESWLDFCKSQTCASDKCHYTSLKIKHYKLP